MIPVDQDSRLLEEVGDMNCRYLVKSITLKLIMARINNAIILQFLADIKKIVNHYTKVMFFSYINIFAICINNALLFSNKNAQTTRLAGDLSISIKNVIFVAAVSLILNIKIINK